MEGGKCTVLMEWDGLGCGVEEVEQREMNQKN